MGIPVKVKIWFWNAKAQRHTPIWMYTTGGLYRHQPSEIVEA